MMSVFFNSNGFLSFIYFGPAYKQKYRYVPRIVNRGPGVPDNSHGFVRGSAFIHWFYDDEMSGRRKYKQKFKIER